MVPSVEPTGCAWRKTSYSAGSGSNGDCAEVAHTEPAVAVRDSKTTDVGNVSASAAVWRAFVTSIARNHW